MQGSRDDEKKVPSVQRQHRRIMHAAQGKISAELCTRVA